MDRIELHKIDLRCTVCNEKRVWRDDEVVAKCDICGQEFEADATCINHHFVCHSCRQKNARNKIIAYCLNSKKTDPYMLMLELMKLPDTAMHGPEHHLLLATALLTAYCNLKGREDLSILLEEANERSLQVPGGACGNWGICGAAIGAGIFSSIIMESSPYAEQEWKSCGQLVSKCGNAISLQGGPRCCKRDSYTAFLEAIKHCNQEFETDFNVPDKITCQFFTNNEECKGINCQFFPTAKANK